MKKYSESNEKEISEMMNHFMNAILATAKTHGYEQPSFAVLLVNRPGLFDYIGNIDKQHAAQSFWAASILLSQQTTNYPLKGYPKITDLKCTNPNCKSGQVMASDECKTSNPCIHGGACLACGLKFTLWGIDCRNGRFAFVRDEAINMREQIRKCEEDDKAEEEFDRNYPPPMIDSF